MNAYMRTIYYKLRTRGYSSDDARDAAIEAWEKKNGEYWSISPKAKY